MITNMLLLKSIQAKFEKYEYKLSKNTETTIQILKQDFQNKFFDLCSKFESDFDRIIENNEV
jgi:hypothetical protein